MMVPAPEPDLHHGVLERINAGFCVIQVLFEGDRAVDYRFIEVNDAFERHTGLKDARGQRMTALEPGHEQDWFRIYGEVARSGRPAQFEMEARALGRSFAVDAVRVGRPGEDKVGILFFDITARKQMEVELGESE
ncbi:MAG: PAS domain S-box protein, partial [Pseudomonas aeruginosa]|nr:PAS domain S-box protein [Pseudomonas aeruginosa]